MNFTKILIILILTILGLQIFENLSNLKEPSNTNLLLIDNVYVLFQYNQPVPSFDTWKEHPLGREYIKLDGIWKFKLDPKNEGINSNFGWYHKDLNEKDWEERPVPSCWDLYKNKNEEDYRFYDGKAWYRYKFKVPEKWKEKYVKLNFLGVNYRCRIWINGRFVGTHEGGNTPFSLDVSDLLNYGKENCIAVQVERRKWGTLENHEIPPKDFDWWPWGGILKSVYLEATSQVTISKIILNAPFEEKILRAYVVIYNHSKTPQTVEIKFNPGYGTGGDIESKKVSLKAQETRVVSFTIPIPQAKSWDLSSPQLYKAVAILNNGDTLFARYGRRSIKIKGSQLLLNGKPIFLKGVNWHSENPKSGGAMSAEEIAQDLNLIKILGANFVRFSHYNRHPSAYEWADENGLLIMDEVENYWMNAYQLKYQINKYGLSLALVLSMVWNQINHPSIVIWSVANECETHTSLGIEFFKTMYKKIKQLDPSQRPITFAAWGSYHGWREELEAFKYVDIIGLNEYFGFFYGVSEDLSERLLEVHKKYPTKPILITESGTWAVHGCHGGSQTPGTEEYQRKYFQDHWSIVMKFKEFVIGYTWWVFADHLSRHQPNSAIPYVSTMGLVDRERKPKLVFEAFQKSKVDK